MVDCNESTCPVCAGHLKYYDKVQRIVRSKDQTVKYIFMRRFKCTNCGMIHRELPNNILPYKHYEADIIKGVLEERITSDTLGYEDYPCEMTMVRWLSRKSHLLLWRNP